jgi:lipopolysaccharide transport system permease protein
MNQLLTSTVTIISPKNRWFAIDFKGIFQSKDLIFLFVRRDFVSFYKQTILGPFWFFIQPLITTLVFTIVFGKIAKLNTDGLPPFLFYMAGVVPWSYFSSCLDKTSNTFSENAGLFGKVYFPRLAVPFSMVITNGITFCIQFITFIAFLFFYYQSGAAVNPNWWILLAPILLIQMALLGLGVGLLISSLTVKYRDLTFLVGFGVQLWMYATPIVYSVSQVPVKWQWLLLLNPMAPIIETFRYAFLGGDTLNTSRWLFSIPITILIFIIGIVFFSRAEKNFMDTI